MSGDHKEPTLRPLTPDEHAFASRSSLATSLEREALNLARPLLDALNLCYSRLLPHSQGEYSGVSKLMDRARAVLNVADGAAQHDAVLHSAALDSKPTNPRQLSLMERLERYSSPEVEKMLRHLTANGNLRDYDDEIANRIEDAADLCVAVRELLPEMTRKPWKCKARPTALPDGQDCDWPMCGCDPHADKVIAAIEESGIKLTRAE